MTPYEARYLLLAFNSPRKIAWASKNNMTLENNMNLTKSLKQIGIASISCPYIKSSSNKGILKKNTPT
jgi:hypothetical protein